MVCPEGHDVVIGVKKKKKKKYSNAFSRLQC